MMDRGKLFQELFECHRKLMADRPAREAQEAATCMWNSIKAESKATPGLVLEYRIRDKVVELKSKARKKKATLMSFWCNVAVKSTEEQTGCSSSTTEGQISPDEQFSGLYCDKCRRIIKLQYYFMYG
jgi:hypothetical protein